MSHMANELFIVLTPGKVGSSTIYNTLKENFKNAFHVHYLSPEKIDAEWHKNLISERKSVPKHLMTSKVLTRRLHDFSGRVNFIVVVREPISREISAVFQNLWNRSTVLEGPFLQPNSSAIEKLLMKELSGNAVSMQWSWLMSEIGKYLEIDVMKIHLNQEHRWYETEVGENRLYILRMEDFSRSLDPLLTKLNSGRQMRIESTNISDEKIYAAGYQDVREHFRLGESDLLKVVESPFFEKFYADKHAEVVVKWLRK